MCVWKRPENLRATIANLQNQKNVRPHLYIWNNNAAIQAVVDSIAKQAQMPVTVIHSKSNIGGFGRFYYARQLADIYRYIVFIDDDQILENDSLAVLWAEAKPRTLHGWWAYNFLSPQMYWLRIRAKRGGHATYIGTCGMIADSSIFKDERLFECPRQYWFIEDLWLSYFAQHVHKWQLLRSHARFRFLLDTKNQVTGLFSNKGRFLRYLSKKGWMAS